MFERTEADDAFTDSGSSPPGCDTEEKRNVPTLDDLFPLDEVEDDELTYFSEVSAANDPGDVEADLDSHCSPSEGTFGAKSQIVRTEDEEVVPTYPSSTEGSES